MVDANASYPYYTSGGGIYLSTSMKYFLRAAAQGMAGGL
jgi:hypothetical protein